MPAHIDLPESLLRQPFSVEQARAAGYHRGRMRGRDLDRPFHGVRAPEGSIHTIVDHCGAYLPRLRRGEHFSHLTAGRLWLAPFAFEHRVSHWLDVTSVAPIVAARGRGVRGHQLSEAPGDVTLRFGLPVASATSTWLQLSGDLAFDDLVAVGDHLILQPKVPEEPERRPYATLEDLTERALHYRGPGCSAARRAVAMLRQGAESRPETLVRLLLHRAGLPEPEVNPEIWDSEGRIGRADLVYRQWRVIVEYDGDQHRTDTDQYEKDMVRLQRFIRAGWDVIRIRKLGLFTEPRATQRLVADALARSGWRPA